MQSSALRTRWAAIGAAVAVTLGAGGVGLVAATSPSGAVAYVPIEPCRAADTRPAPDNVGPRNTPIGAAETHVINRNDGGCAGDVPGTATGLQLNVTATGASAASFITIWASGPLPLASSLNPTPGQPPVPNAVTTSITGAGNFNIYNNVGTVNVIVDIVGYYTDHNHDDRYYTEAEIDARTLTRNLSLPALALNETSTSAVITHASNGLTWQNSFAEAAEIFVRRPQDWSGQGNVVLRIFFRRTNSTAGNVQFFTRPRDYNDGDPFADASGISSDVQTEANTDFYEVAMTIPASQLPKDWWDIVIQRSDSVAGAYPDAVVVVSVDLEYIANT